MRGREQLVAVGSCSCHDGVGDGFIMVWGRLAMIEGRLEDGFVGIQGWQLKVEEGIQGRDPKPVSLMAARQNKNNTSKKLKTKK